MGERSAQREGEPEEGKQEHQLNALEELEREAAVEMQQRDELEDEKKEKEQYEEEEVFFFSD